MKFFVPDWDDRVDPDYQFDCDRYGTYPEVRDPYHHDKYAHELMPERTYDGILVSRMALGEAGPKRKLIDRDGMRAYLRLPPHLKLIADCGAFGYVEQEAPPFTTVDMVDYYDRLRFDYGVSIDHVIVRQFLHDRERRFKLTQDNAEDFIQLHRTKRPRFTPIGAVQGWDPSSYVRGALEQVEMGYDYLGLGGLARSNTRIIHDVVEAVSMAVPKHVRLHVFGVARPALLEDFMRFDVYSVDSAAPLRQAWLSVDDNYFALDESYAALRIPRARDERAKKPRSSRAKVSLLGRDDVSLKQLQVAEAQALAAIRSYANATRRSKRSFREAVRALMDYDALFADRAFEKSVSIRRDLYERTLWERPWRDCRCSICRKIGVEVMIFRGNDRNRRRGFHNLYVVRQRIERGCTNRKPIQTALPLLTP